MRELKTELILKMIAKMNHGEVFIAKDFSEIADYETARKALNRLVEAGIIHKILRGVYYNPRYSPLLQEYEAPSPHNVAFAIARKFNWNIAPSGVTAMNLLGLSTQVPAKWSYISDGAYNTFKMGNITIEFKHRNNREIAGMSYKTALVIQALKEIGKENVCESTIEKIRKVLSDEERTALLRESKASAVWIHNSISKIVSEDKQ